MPVVQFFIMLALELVLNSVTLAILLLVLHRLRVSKRLIVFASFALLGTLLGALSALSLDQKELMFNINMPGIWLGDEIHYLAVDHFGNPHDNQAEFTVIWCLQRPQVYLFASVPVWGMLGLFFQGVYSLVDRLFAHRGRTQGQASTL